MGKLYEIKLKGFCEAVGYFNVHKENISERVFSGGMARLP